MGDVGSRAARTWQWICAHEHGTAATARPFQARQVVLPERQ